ncbi:hypothetical protein GALL_547860 [mine drainage metagenome]|uniref:Uncharacterized protein n=1 Tax=mine drainage metagenome TaxID=410659 RepID=A0A1J5NWS3_9ZZZZ
MLLPSFSVRTTMGRRNTIRSVFVAERELERNSAPRPGMSPRPGILVLFSFTLSCISPPSTMVCPSLTSTAVWIERLLVMMPAELVALEMLDTS